MCSMDQKPIYKAISNGHFRTVQCLLDHGAYVSNAQQRLKKYDGSDYEAAILFIAIPFESIFRLLLDRGANPRAMTQLQEFPEYVLFKALQSGEIALVQMLLDRGVPLQTPPTLGIRSDIMRYAIDGGEAMVDFIVDQGFTLESTSEEGKESILEWAVYNENPGVLEFLLKKDVLTNKALHSHGRDMLESLVAADSSIEAAKAKIDRLLALLGIDIEAQDRSMGPCLHVATMIGSDDIISFLLKRGANPLSEHKVVRCMHPLSHAVERGNFTKTRYLLEAIDERGIPLQDWRYLAEKGTVKKREPKIKRLLEYYYWRGRYPPPGDSRTRSDSKLTAKGSKRRRNSSGDVAGTSRYNLRARKSVN